MDDSHPEVLNERTLAEQLDLKNRALDMAAEGIAISDCRQPDNPLIYCNQGFEELTGYAHSEVLGRNCRFLQGPETDPGALAEIRDALRTERECHVDLLNYRKDGTTFWNRLSIAPIRDADGLVTHFIAVQSDITALRDALDDLRDATRRLRRANLRMSRDLDAAGAVQRALLPVEPPRVPGLRTAWVFEPCDELAGDILDVFQLGPRHVGLYLLDVVGHGVPAALHSVTLYRLLSTAVGQLRATGIVDPRASDVPIAPPTEVAAILNRMFANDDRTEQFFTMVYGILDVTAGVFRYVSAGHPPVLHVPRRGATRVLEATGLPVGVVADASYDERQVAMQAGDRLYLYSDGVPETPNANCVPFGRSRLLEAVERGRSLPLEESLEVVQAALHDFRGSADVEDDVSMLALEVVPE